MSLVAWYPLNGNLKDNCGGQDLTTNCVYGDLNEDGMVTQTDYDMLKDYLEGTGTLTDLQLRLADVNQDGTIDESDLSEIYDYINYKRDKDTLINKPIEIMRINSTWEDGKTGKSWKCTSHKCVTNRVDISKLKGIKKFSISFWIKINSVESNFKDMVTFITKKETDNSIAYLRFESVKGSNSFYGAWYNNRHLGTDGYVTTTTTDPITTGEWQHVVSIFDGTKALTYVNGELKNTKKYATTDADKVYLTGEFQIGSHQEGSTTYYFDGSICNVKIYDHILSQSEINQDYKQPMLHYSFENPYVEQANNLKSSFTKYFDPIVTGTDDIGDYFVKSSTDLHYYGIGMGAYKYVRPNTYYTWSLEVNPEVDLFPEDQVSKNPTTGISSFKRYGYFDGNITSDVYTDNDQGFELEETSSYNDIIPANKWTRIWLTTKVKAGIGSNARIYNYFAPILPEGISNCKIHYRNGMLENKDHISPYVYDYREPGKIRDNSGMGNDGTIVYKRQEIPVNIQAISSHSRLTPTIDSNNNIIITNFENTADKTNVTSAFAKINYDSRFHYLNSIVSYEFDMKLENIVKSDNVAMQLQWETFYTDGTSSWMKDNELGEDAYPRIRLERWTKNITDGTYSVKIQFKHQLTEMITNVAYYQFGLRCDNITSGTITISDFHAYFEDLDISPLSITDTNSAIGSYSSYYNGKNYIKNEMILPEYMDAVTVSAWVYCKDWKNTQFNPSCAIVSCIQQGGFGIKNIADSRTLGDNFYFRAYYENSGYPPGVALFPPTSELSEGWHHLVGVANKNSNITYIDGEEYGRKDYNLNERICCIDNDSDKINNLYIGAEYDSEDNIWFLDNMYIDDVRIYPIELSAEDIKSLYSVKSKVDKDGNLFCNQLVEAKPDNMFPPLSEGLKTVGYGSIAYTKKYENGIFTFTISNDYLSTSQKGPYFDKTNHGGFWIVGKKYRYSLWVMLETKVATDFKIRVEQNPENVIKTYPVGKWFKIEWEGTAASGSYNALIFYTAQPLYAGDKIHVRNVEMYRLDTEQDSTSTVLIQNIRNVPPFNTNVVEKYGATWLRVFHHNNQSGTVFFTDEAEALNIQTEDKHSILYALENFRGRDGKFEFLLEYLQEYSGLYNRWKQTDNPVTVAEVVTGKPYKANGYESIHLDWDTNGVDDSTKDIGFCGLLKSTFLDGSQHCIIDGSIGVGAWFHALGVKTKWGEGMPGPDSSQAKAVNEVDLYVKLDLDIEEYQPRVTKQGQLKTFEISEIDDEDFTNYKLVTKHGKKWLQVFHHNIGPNKDQWFKDEAEALNCDGKYKYSILDQLEDFRGSDGKFEFLLEYPLDLPGKYNHWKQTDNPAIVVETTTQATGYEAIHVDWTTRGWLGLLKNSATTPRTFIDGGTLSNWYYAIGCYNNSTTDWYNALPGPDNYSSNTMHEVNLYVALEEEFIGATIMQKDGAEWLRVFHHNNRNGTILFENEEEALSCETIDKFSILRKLENFRGKDGKFEFLLEWPEDYPAGYMRWRQSKNPLDDNTVYEFDTNSYLIGKVEGYEEIYNPWYTPEQRWAGLLRNQHSDLSLLDGIIGDHWYYAIGAYQSYSTSSSSMVGIPGPEQKDGWGKVAIGPTELYVRIDNIDNRNKIFKLQKKKTSTKEIIEI